MTGLKYECIFYFIILSGFLLQAGNELGVPFIRNYGPEEYFAHSQNFAIVQDQRGMIYVGNNMGVVEFDGKVGRLYKMQNLSHVRSMAVDQRGTVFVGAIGDFGYLAYGPEGNLRHVNLKNKVKPEDQEVLDVWSTHVTSRGVYFVTDRRIFHWDYKRMTVIKFMNMPPASKVNDRLLVPQKETGIYWLQKDQPVLLPGTAAITRDAEKVHCLPYKDGKMLILSDTQGFFLYDWSSGSSQSFPSEIAEYLRVNILYCSCVVNDHQYAFGTSKGGILIMDDRGKLVQIINTNRGLQDNMIRGLFVDRDQNLWGALNYGFAHIEISSPLSRFNQLNKLDGIVLSVIRFQGRLYVGTFNGIFYLPEYRMSLTDDHRYFIQVKNTQSYCFNLYAYGDILFGLGAEGIYQIIDDQAFLLKRQKNPYCFGQTRKFPGAILVGTNTGLVALKIDHSTRISGQPWVKTEIIDSGSFQQIKEPIRKIAPDEQENVWLSTELNGIIHIEWPGPQLTAFQWRRLTTADGLPSLATNRIYNLDNQLAVATARGIYWIVKTGQSGGKINSWKIVPDTARFKFFHDHNYYIIFWDRDKRNQFWIASGGGFGICIPQQDGSYYWDPVPFRKIRGRTEQVYAEDDGVTWICGVESRCLWRFDSGIKKSYDFHYPALIRTVAVGKERKIVFLGNFYNPQSKSGDTYACSSLLQPADLTFKFSYRQNPLYFDYSAAFYEQAEQNLYSYVMEGFDEQWSAWAPDNKKEYSILPEGNYCFKVKAMNVFLQESSVAAFRFTIFPPWQRTWWAYLGYFIIGGCLFYFAIRLNSQRLIAAKIRLEKIVSERTAEVVKQKQEIEEYASDLYHTNRQLTEARNALWGEMELAKKIQTVLLPEEPQIPGYEIAAYMRPAAEVGGDYYDVINVAGTHWIAIGDVSGHGVPAGLVMMMAQTAIRAVIRERPEAETAQVLKSVNETIHENIKKLGENKYMTITLMSVQEEGAIHYSGLHQDIMVYRTKEKKVELVETQGMWIGLMDNIDGMIGVDQLTLAPGDVMLLYTDGIVEATGDGGQLFSEEKLVNVFQSVAGQLPALIIENILNSLTGYQCSDDVTLLAIKRL